MKPLQEIENLVNQVIRIVEANKQSEIRLNANGGNSILLVCLPEQEIEFIDTIRKMMDANNYRIIDLNELLIEYVKQYKSDLEEYFKYLQSSLHQIFKSPEGESEDDLYNYIMNKIDISFEKNKIPVLCNTGTLYGTGIDNIHLMENKVVMNSSLPLVILYPAKEEGDKLMFLNSRPASKYRCMIIK